MFVSSQEALGQRKAIVATLERVRALTPRDRGREVTLVKAAFESLFELERFDLINEYSAELLARLLPLTDDPKMVDADRRQDLVAQGAKLYGSLLRGATRESARTASDRILSHESTGTTWALLYEYGRAARADDECARIRDLAKSRLSPVEYDIFVRVARVDVP
jgi:hypothetical protein